MIKCVLISNDTRTTLQMRGWFRMFQSEPYLEIHPTIERFEEKYAEPLKQRDQLIEDPSDLSAEEKLDERSKAEKLAMEADITPIKLLIVDLDAVPSRPLEWIVATRDSLAEKGHSIVATPIRVMLLGYDDPHLRPDRFRHELVDDMVIKPLDQQLFLQKVELLLADKPDISPSFLFRARAEGTIELGKDAVIDEISDFAISIRNPGPLSEGVFAQVHSRAFGTGLNSSRVLARAYASVRHPQYEGLWLVRFALFGVSSTQLAELRKFIRSRQVPTRARVAPSSKKSVKEKDRLPPRNRIAVIDLDREVLLQAHGTIEENFARTASTIFPSYTRFLAGIARLSGQIDSATDDAATAGAEDAIGEDGIPNGRITINVTDKEFLLQSFEPALPPQESFLGRPAAEWLASPESWIEAIPPGDTEDFEEFLSYTTTGGQGVTGLRLLDKNGRFIYVEVKGRFLASTTIDTPSILRLELKQVERSAWLELNRLVSKGATPDMFRFDTIIIDGGLLRTDAQSWLEGLHSALSRAQVIAKSDPLPKIIILADESSRVTPEQFAHRGIVDFIYKPLDRKLLTDKLATALPQLTRTVHLETSPFVPCEITAQVCKAVHLEELSEYGLTVVHPTPFRPRVFMRFFSPLFGEAGEGVLGRCVASTPTQGDPPSYKCHFVFFGASDELYKRIRNWIREDYVQKKEANG